MAISYEANVCYLDSLEQRIEAQGMDIRNVHSVSVIELRHECFKYQSVFGHENRSFVHLYLSKLRRKVQKK